MADETVPQAPPEPQAGSSQSEFNPSDFVPSYLATIQSVVTQPRDFFAQMPTKAGYGNPLIYGLPAAAVSGFLGALVSSASMIPGLGAGLGGAAGVGIGAAVAGLILGPIAFVIGSFIFGAILHASAYIFCEKAKGGFEGTWRTAAYSQGSVMLVSWIPVIGGLASLYGLYMIIMGIQQVHKTSTGKAVAAVLVPVAIIAGIMIALAVIAMVIGASIIGAGMR